MHAQLKERKQIRNVTSTPGSELFPTLDGIEL